MPILYSKTKKQFSMITISDMTQADALDIIAFQPMYSFTEPQAKRLIQLVKSYIDPTQADCHTCGGGIRPAKNKIIKFYAEWKQMIDPLAYGTFDKQHTETEEVIEIPEAKAPKKKSTKKK